MVDQLPASSPGTSFETSETPESSSGARPRAGCLELGSFSLELGGGLADARLAYALDGPTDGPVVVAMGGISATRWVGRDANGEPGWWAGLIGPGKAVDTRRTGLLSFDFLCGNGASSEPREGLSITTRDQARALEALLDALEIDALAGIVGASYGGMIGLAFAAMAPNRVERLVAIGAADRAYPQSTACRCLQRRIVRLARREGWVEEGMVLARALAMTSYRTAEEFEQRFSDPPRRTDSGFQFPVEGYLESRGKAFARSFDSVAFLTLSESIDLHRIDGAEIFAPTTLVAATSDRLVPPHHIRELSRNLSGPSRLVEIESLYGHDAFLKEIETLNEVLAEEFDAMAGGRARSDRNQEVGR